MSEFDVDGKRYRTNRKLDAFSQLHLARKLAPLIVSLTPSQEMRQKLQADAARNGEDRPLVDIAELAMPVIEGLAEMKTEDVDFISSTCLGVVQRYQGVAWADVWNAPAKRMMFDDIDGMALLQITFNVLQENLANFMRAPLSALSQPSQTTGENHESMSGSQKIG